MHLVAIPVAVVIQFEFSGWINQELKSCGVKRGIEL
jgi:hypothetical protein